MKRLTLALAIGLLIAALQSCGSGNLQDARFAAFTGVDTSKPAVKKEYPRCGRPKKKDGQPCRSIVKKAGDACHWHS